MKCPSYTMGCKIKAMPKMMPQALFGDLSKLEHFEGLFCLKKDGE